jgi:hypothetical protein
MPKQQMRRHPTSFTTTIGDEEEENATYTQQGTEEVMPEQHLQPIVQPMEVQETMLSQMLA